MERLKISTDTNLTLCHSSESIPSNMFIMNGFSCKEGQNINPYVIYKSSSNSYLMELSEKKEVKSNYKRKTIKFT